MMNRAFSLLGGNPLPRGQNYVPDNQVYKLTQTVSATSVLTSSVTVSAFASFNFQLSNLDQVATLQAAFDQYRLDRIEFWLIPRFTDNATGTGVEPGLLCSVIDYDDSNVLTTFQASNDYDNCITSSGLSGHYRIFQPHVAVAAYSGTFTSFANEPAGWIDAASPSVQHYGIKLAISTTDSVYKWDSITRYHVSLRNVR
jgi:hypothetical protein